VFTCRNQATHISSRDRCIAKVLHVTILSLLWESLKDVNAACGKNVNILNLKADYTGNISLCDLGARGIQILHPRLGFWRLFHLLKLKWQL
jgi:hypothetical protein